jgi:crotonobetaine/carnitine-CoA ligase
VLDPMGDRSIADLLAERADQYAERTFLVFEDAHGEVRRYTYREFDALSRRCAGGLHELGVSPGDFVLVDLVNRPELLITWFAAARLGARLVPSNVANTAGELEHILTVAPPRLVVTETALADTVQQGLALVGARVPTVVVDGAEREQIPFASLLDSGAQPPERRVASSEIAELIFTSGTTRKPKAVMITHANCLRGGLDSVHCLWLDEGERCLTALPMFHVNAQAMSLFAAITVGGTLVLVQEFRAGRFWEQVRRHRATQTCLVAMQLRTILAQPPARSDREHSLRRLFYAINVTDAEKEAFERRFGVSLINGYGLSEGMTLLTCAPVVGPHRWPSIGLPSPGRRILLLDEAGAEVGAGEVGEIVAVGT